MNDRLIAERIATLLAHYWTPEMAPDLRAHLSRDWLEDLAEFPAQFVAEACKEWRQTNTRRPTPADIRILCIAAQREAEERRPKPKPAAITDMHREPIPAPDVVRPGWKRIPLSLLTEAERKLFEADTGSSVKQVLAAMAGRSAKPVPTVQGEAKRLPEIKPPPLPAEDDPEVQRLLAEMGA